MGLMARQGYLLIATMIHESIRTHLEIAILVTGKIIVPTILYVRDKNKILLKMSDGHKICVCTYNLHVERGKVKLAFPT